jgi:hypothetical protein
MLYIQTKAPIRSFNDQRLIDNFIDTVREATSWMYEASFLLVHSVPYGIYIISTIVALIFCIFLFRKYINNKRSSASGDNEKKEDLISFETNDFKVQMQLDLATSLIRMKQYQEAKKILANLNAFMTKAQRSYLEILKSKLR